MRRLVSGGQDVDVGDFVNVDLGLPALPFPLSLLYHYLKFILQLEYALQSLD